MRLIITVQLIVMSNLVDEAFRLRIVVSLVGSHILSLRVICFVILIRLMTKILIINNICRCVRGSGNAFFFHLVRATLKLF